MAQKLSQLPNGAKIEFISFLGAKIPWRKIGSNLTGMPSGSTSFITDEIVALRPFDAKEPSNSDSNRKSYGNNDWAVSNIRQWLNSDAAAGGWYKAQHSADAPPSEANVWSGYNDYQSDAGFLNAATAQEKAALIATDRKFGSRSGNATTSTDKIFLLTATELGIQTLSNDGTKIPYFSDNASRVAKVSANAAKDSEYSVSAGANHYYWTCSSYSGDSYYVWYVYSGGSTSGNVAWYGNSGVRPACNLSSDILVSDSTNANGCYTIIFNQAPTVPDGITVPETIQSTKQYTVSWGKATDPDGNLQGYTLQRNLNDTGWTQVFRGSAQTYSDTLDFGTSTVQYRVQAYDAAGATSDWVQSEKRTVQNNRAPVISGSDRDLGNFTATAPTLEYTVTDADNDTVTVTEYLDDTQLKQYQAELGVNKSITLDPTAWTMVLNGQHSYKVVVKDSNNATAERKVTFTKTIGKIEFTLSKKMETDGMPTMALVNIQGSFPPGCNLQVFMCNNANDPEPTWEDVTNQARNGQKVFFANETKVAEKWAVNVKVIVERNTAQGEVYVTSVGGNFR